MPEIEVHPVTPDREQDLIELFERKGPRGGTPATDWCWCMWWRARSHDRAKNKTAMIGLVREAREPGLVAYEDGVPVGWISVAPREEFEHLYRSTTLKPNDPSEEGVFSIVCFYVYPTAARRGVATELVVAAVEHARARGARVIEAYPSQEIAGTSGQDFMGSKRMFAAAGFESFRKTRSRTIVRRALRPPSDAG